MAKGGNALRLLGLACLAGVVGAAGLASEAMGAAPAAGQGQAAAVVRIDTGAVEGRVDRGLWANVGYDPMWAATCNDAALLLWRRVRQSGCIVRVRSHNTFTSGVSANPWTVFPATYMGCDIYSEDEAGRPRYNFYWLDEVLDTWVAAGVAPIIELDFMPDQLAEGPIVRNYGGGAINAPRDYRRWAELVRATVAHCVERYGLEEVRRWRFEIWNEPDLATYFIDGGKLSFSQEPTADEIGRVVARLCRMYDFAAAAIKAVDGELKVGGPGIAGNRFYLRGFLEHCARGRNAATGGRGAPVDFISWHGYAATDVHAQKNAMMRQEIARVDRRLLQAELEQDEWGLALRGDPALELCAVRSYEAASLCKMIDAMWHREEGRVDLFLRWGQPVSDRPSGGWRRLMLWAGGRLIPFPIFQAYELLARLGPERIAARVEGVRTVGCLAARSDGGVQVVIYNLDERDLQYRGPVVRVAVELSGLRFGDGAVPVRHFRLDSQHGAVVERWFAMGRPRQLGPQQVKELARAAEDIEMAEPREIEVRGGRARFEVSMPPNCVSFLFIGRMPAAPRFEARSGHVRRLLEAEDAWVRAMELVVGGRAEEGEAALRGIAERYAGLHFARRAMWKLAELCARGGRFSEAMEWGERLLRLPLRAFDRTALLEWLAQQAGRAGDAARRGRYLAEQERALNEQGASRRWVVGALAAGARAEAVKVGADGRVFAGGAEVRLGPVNGLVGGICIAGRGRMSVAVIGVEAAEDMAARLEMGPYTTLAAYVNGRIVWRRPPRGRIKNFVSVPVRLKRGRNVVAVVFRGRYLYARVLGEDGRPDRRIGFAAVR